MFKFLIKLIKRTEGWKKYEKDFYERQNDEQKESWEITYKWVKTEVKTRKKKSGVRLERRIKCSHAKTIGKTECIPYVQWFDECKYCRDNPNSSMIIAEEEV